MFDARKRLDRKKLVGVRLPGRSRETGSVPVTKSGKSGIGQLWVGLLLSALVLVFLLIFILQNSASVRIAFFGWDGALPAGVALLFAAIGGVLLVAVPGSVRIAQLRRQARRETRTSREPEHQP
jgi:lipopolysaccharide assembly protein A